MCKHIQMCVCVCSGMFVDMVMGTDNTRFGVATNHRESLRCDWSPMSTSFIILIKTCMKTESWTRDGFGDLVMRGEGVRHPTTSVRRRLTPSICSCVCLINQAKKFGLIKYKCPDVVERKSIGNVRIRRGPFFLSFVPLLNILYLLGFLVKQWQSTLKTLTLFTKTKLN
jgi:hypothetical protein